MFTFWGVPKLDFTLLPSDRWESVSATEKKLVWYEWCTRQKFQDGGIVTPSKLAFFLWDYVIPRHWFGNMQPEKKRARATSDVDEDREGRSVKRVKSERRAEAMVQAAAQTDKKDNTAPSASVDDDSFFPEIREVADWSDEEVMDRSLGLGDIEPEDLTRLAELAEKVNVKGTEEQKAAYALRRIWQYPLSASFLGPWDPTILDIHDDQIRAGLVDPSDDNWDVIHVIIETAHEAAITFADYDFDPDYKYVDKTDDELSRAIAEVIFQPGVCWYADVKYMQQEQRRQQVKEYKYN